MKLRFLKKRDGSKVLQERQGAAWKDIPMEEEKSIQDEAVTALEVYRARTTCYPTAVMLGKIDHAYLKEEMLRYSLRTPFGRQQIELMGVPVLEHPYKPHGIFLIEEVE